MHPLDDELDILFDEQEIARKVAEIAGRISRDHAGTELVVLCVLNAAAVFTADLVRSLDVPSRLLFITATSYGASTASSGTVGLSGGGEPDIAGRQVLIVDTVADSGRTLDAVLRRYRARGPARIDAAVLLDKRARREVSVPIRYVGWEIPDRFVVGYGLDAAGRYRNLPYIAALRRTEDAAC